MQLNLKNPLVFFDLETTGINISTDRIVEISYLKVYPDGREESKTMRINPGRPIPPEATAVHKITDADVADCPTFKEVASRSLHRHLPAQTHRRAGHIPQDGATYPLGRL